MPSKEEWIVDGFVPNPVPLQFKQFVFFQSFSFLYLLWNIIHAYSGIGNPYDGVTQDDDAIIHHWKLEYHPGEGHNHHDGVGTVGGKPNHIWYLLVVVSLVTIEVEVRRRMLL